MSEVNPTLLLALEMVGVINERVKQLGLSTPEMILVYEVMLATLATSLGHDEGGKKMALAVLDIINGHVREAIDNEFADEQDPPQHQETTQ